MFVNKDSKTKTIPTKNINTKPMEEEEIDTKTKPKEITISPKKEKKKNNESDDDLEKIEKDNNENVFNLSSDDEKELLRINLKKNIVVRILDINDEKFVDFCKFYKGYPTKKNIRIKYKTYLKLKDLLILN